MNKNLSLHQRIFNAAATQEVEFIHATHTYYHARANATEEWSQIWSQCPEVSWAHGFGRMRGFKNVWNGSVTLYDVKAFQKFTEMYEIMPEIGGFDPRPLMELSLHALATDIIEVADDGKTARASFLTPGIISSSVTNNGVRRCGGLWERYGADFVFEDGCWLFLHEHVCPDMGIGCDGNNPGMNSYLQAKNGGGMSPMMLAMGPSASAPAKAPAGMPAGGAPGGMPAGGPPAGGAPGGMPAGGPPAGGAPGGMPAGGAPGGAPGGFPGGGLRTMPDVDDPGPMHSQWSITQTVQNTVPWPEPYATMDDNNTYTKRQ